MARARRLALAGELHYLVQRGHNRQSVFADDRDRETYLAMLRDAAVQCGVAIHAYALLPTEVHLLATPRTDESLSRLMQSLGRRYVAAHNHRHGRSGTLWSGRFHAGVIGASFGVEAMVHIESMPVQAGLAAWAGEWPWSSAAHHLGRRRDALIAEHPAYWALGNTPFDRESAHAHKLAEALPLIVSQGIERAVAQGGVFGEPAFRASVAHRTGRPLQPRPRGRPPRSGLLHQ